MTNDMFYQTNIQGFCPYRAFASTQSYQTQGVAIGLRAPLPLWGVLAAAQSFQNPATKCYGVGVSHPSKRAESPVSNQPNGKKKRRLGYGELCECHRPERAKALIIAGIAFAFSRRVLQNRIDTQGVAIGLRAPLPLWGALAAAAQLFPTQATKGYGILFRKEDEE